MPSTIVSQYHSIGELAAAQEQERSKDMWTMVACLCIALLALIFAAVTIAALASSERPQSTTKSDGELRETEKDVKTERTPTEDFELSTTESLGTEIPASDATTESTPEATRTTTTTAATTTTTTTKPPKGSAFTQESPLLCTVSNKFTAESAVPADGVCDFLFYDSLYRDHRNTLIEYDYFDAGLKHFLSLSSSCMVTTSLGVSLSTQNAEVYEHFDFYGYTHDVHQPLKSRVSHFGLLDSTDNFLMRHLEILEKLHDHMEEAQPDRIHHTVITVEFKDTQELIQITKSVFTPSLLIAATHATGNRYNTFEPPPCRILPPTSLAYPAGIPRSHIGNELPILEAMEHFALARDADFHVPTAISFTMRALVYKPTDVWDTDAAAYGFFEPCQEFGPAISSLPPALACTSAYTSSLEYRDAEAAVFTFNSTTQRVVTFEITSVLKRKICEAMIADWNRAFGIAVYDVEYDAEDLPCERFNHTGGSFSRLEAIKGMLHYAEKTRDDGLLRRYSSADKFCAQAALGSYYVPESTNGRAGDGGERF